MLKEKQLVFPMCFHGGKREGAGRKPKGQEPEASHTQRSEIRRGDPLHITVKLLAGLPSLRRPAEMQVIRRALRAARELFGMRIIHYVVLGNHLHLIVEAEDRKAVASGMNGLLVRMTKGLNRVWQRSGRVLAQRYHDEVITSPRQARNTLRYVLNNAQKHGIVLPGSIDPCSSGLAFDGWRRPSIEPQLLDTVVPPRVWVLCVGWRRWGLIGMHEVPSS